VIKFAAVITSGNGEKLDIKSINTGVLGGTFNPVHNGHVAIAEAARMALGLDEVFFIPTGQPHLKDSNVLLAAEHRVQMVSVAIKDKPFYKLSTIEIERSGHSYTVDTLTELRQLLGYNHEIFFILGWDSLAQLPYWKEPDRIIKMCKLVAVSRPGYSLPDIVLMEDTVPGITERVIILDKPEIDISSSDIRERVAGGLDVSHLLPGPVEEYIRKNRLYMNE
jgi:nicotinate-nucleotide adenylyltransferase